MPIFVAALIGGLVSAAGSIVGRVLIAMGIGLVTYTGINITLSQFMTDFINHASAAGPTIVGVMGTLKVGTDANILASSLAARLTLNGLTGGTVKRWIAK